MKGALGLITICAVIWIFWMTWVWLRRPKEKLETKKQIDELFSCFEIHRANMPQFGCTKQCNECRKKQEEITKRCT